MNSQLEEFNEKITELREAVTASFMGQSADEKLFALRDLLLSQLDVCAFHYKLMHLESGGRHLFAESSFSDMVGKHLELVKLFRDLRKPGEKSTYETKSIGSFYWYLAAHFEDKGDAQPGGD